MSRVMTVAGALLSLGFMVLSAAISWRYGHSIGREGVDQLLFAALSLAADIAKAATPFFFWYAAKNARLMPAAAALLFWLAATGFSLSSAGGFAEVNRAEQSGRHVIRKSDYGSLNVEIERKEAQIKALGGFEPPAVIAPRLEAMRQNARWVRSWRCADATARESRSFCAEYHLLEAAREKGIEAARLESEIASLRSRLAGLAGAAAAEEGDPRARFLSRVTGWSVARIETGLTLLFIAVLEIGSGLGLFIALNHGGHADARSKQPPAVPPASVGKHEPLPAPVKRDPAPPKPALPKQQARALPDKKPIFGDVAKFARARLAAAQGDAIDFEDLYAAYVKWCGEQDVAALPGAEFRRQFIVLSAQVGFQHGRRGGKHLCLDLKLAA